MVNWCCRGLGCSIWKEAWQMRMGCPCWMALTERTVKLRPSLMRSTWYSTGTLGYEGLTDDLTPKQTLTVGNPVVHVQLFQVQHAGDQDTFEVLVLLGLRSLRVSILWFQRSRIQVWLYEQVNMRIEGCIIGFDEYMNLVLDDAEEVHMKTKNRKPLGRIMLKGDNITLLQSVTV
ncbi:hypothetical protein F7725_016477 [Dissostichus mawsoni]|uniref:Small nuclear ribonucleoprotein E n=1 Tax=Dissostichus mawsoni TaxID=36200 RepID=A0A7J5Z1U0_DISMA|nr:hypothetical protein F7725_016477 [Dissostichus mawsoni]